MRREPTGSCRSSQSPRAWKKISTNSVAASRTNTRAGRPREGAATWRRTSTSTVTTAGSATSRTEPLRDRSIPPLGSVNSRSRGLATLIPA